MARRVVPAPVIPQPVLRLPRPDDPTPRKPPLVIFGKKVGQSQRAGSFKSREPEVEDPSLKRGKEITKTVPLKAGGAKNLGRSASFRVPDDVFGSTPLATSALSVKSKGKGKVEGLSSEQFETLNKAVSGVAAPQSSFVFRGTLMHFWRSLWLYSGMKEVKKSAVKFLSKYGITKEDPDFKEVFGFVYRGASFALVSLVILSRDPGRCFTELY